MNIEDKELYTCKEVGEYLDMTAMAIGRMRNEVCDESDVEGKKLKKSGLQKVLNHLKMEMDLIESTVPCIVKVRIQKKQCKSPRHLFAYDLDRKIGCAVLVPPRDKERLNKPNL
ncbi:MAG: hypothetical protein ACR2PH_11540, partial [Desulfobulbia bacterium]